MNNIVIITKIGAEYPSIIYTISKSDAIHLQEILWLMIVDTYKNAFQRKQY